MTKALFSQRDLEAYKTLKPVKLAVAPGLRLYVSPKGIKTWFVRYSIADVMTERALGAFGHGEGGIYARSGARRTGDHQGGGEAEARPSRGRTPRRG
jgi:hypothetical protein